MGNLKPTEVQLTFDTVRHSRDRLQTDELALNKITKTVIEKKNPQMGPPTNQIYAYFIQRSILQPIRRYHLICNKLMTKLFYIVDNVVIVIQEQLC